MLRENEHNEDGTISRMWVSFTPIYIYAHLDYMWWVYHITEGIYAHLDYEVHLWGVECTLAVSDTGGPVK